MADIAIDPRLRCSYCANAEVVYNASEGTAVCTGCGTVLEEHCFDEGMDWRNFAPEGVDSQPNGRIHSDITNSIDQMTGQGGGTMIVGDGMKVQRMQEKLLRVQNSSKPELSAEQKEANNIKHFTEKAREVAGMLKLGDQIVNRCTMLLQDLAAKGLLDKKSYQIPWYCALLEIACEEEPDAQKTVHDFAHAMPSKVELPQLKRMDGIFTATFSQAAVVKELKAQVGEVAIGGVNATLTVGGQPNVLLVRCKEQAAFTEAALEDYFRQELEDIQQKKSVASISKHYDALCSALERARAIYIETEDLYKSYVQKLGLAAEVVKPAKYIATQALKLRVVRTGKELSERSMVTGAMASAIYVVAWLLEVEKMPRLEDVAKAAKVTQGYAKTAYALIRKDIIKLLPQDYVRRYIKRVQTLPQVSRKRPAPDG